VKIAVIASSQVPSDTANSIQVMKVCQAMEMEGHHVCLYVPGDGPTSWGILAAHYGLSSTFEVRWLHSNLAWHRYDLAWNALQQARRWGAHLIYTWMLQTAFLAQWKGIPVILEMHMLPSGRFGPRLFRNFMLGKGKKRVLVITNALRKDLENLYNLQFPPSEVQIAPMGSEPKRYLKLPPPPQARKQLHLPQGITVGYTGHLYPGRGMEILLYLAHQFPKINFLWVGGRCEDVAYWQSRLDKEGLKNVLLTGFVKNQHLPLYQSAAEILIMPYQEEIAVSSGGDTSAVCSPMKMFEYLAAGRAILSSDLPVLHEVLNESNAVFCPPHELEKWRAALACLLDDKDMRVRLSTQARSDALQYSWRKRASHALEGFS
jgi:glycosyltransferase involved in cell wall biosynthesis